MSDLFERAQRVIPGGVNSPVRAFNAVGGDPIYVVKGEGTRLTTTDGRELLDFCGSWGPLVLGHSHPKVIAAIQKAVADGTSFGINTPREVEFAELLCGMAGIDKVRLVNSGTEATMTAIRLARGATGRSKIIKFAGCYHGHSDGLLVAAGSGLMTGGVTSSAGVPESVAADVFLPEYNDLAAVNEIVDARGDELAAIILEPIAANMGLVPPDEGFLAGLREAADRCGAVLIFDEVITGFRLGPCTYAQQCGVQPDLVTLGKIIGGGLPIGAVGGKAAVMDNLAPLGEVYQAGTLSGNPVAVAAGLTTLQLLAAEPPYEGMAALAGRLAAETNDRAVDAGAPLRVRALGSMFTPFFCESPIRNYTDAKRCDTKQHAAFFHAMLDAGIYLPPSQFEVGFVSAAHTEADVDQFVEAAASAL
ncbi:MAG: glutamate-1-semialdehyde 2,1-aminomutase [Kiritimatiellia bacterium]|nr:glutamate-1-semialdehyde 2,1-aminomutase [Kiritimatiellia bacterium]MDP6809468.1 glutamate-1-semialdehyde 2,1-aminomutase [Kiritimatiellia bacterium]MDP7023855.1 glutamate-1-semialdehyde 2,1-aminomutase [Kiritimatiellia bacterium]